MSSNQFIDPERQKLYEQLQTNIKPYKHTKKYLFNSSDSDDDEVDPNNIKLTFSDDDDEEKERKLPRYRIKKQKKENRGSEIERKSLLAMLKQRLENQAPAKPAPKYFEYHRDPKTPKKR